MDFLRERGTLIEIVFIIFVIIIITVFIKKLIIKGFEKTQRLSNLKNGKTKAKEIIGTVKTIEMGAGSTGLGGKYIVTWYIIVEGKDPITNSIQTYKSQTYQYQEDSSNKIITTISELVTEKDKESINKHINKYVKIGDKVKIKISLENTKDYIIEDVMNRK